jgi:periplasmic divalent cation tolerance protein
MATNSDCVIVLTTVRVTSDWRTLASSLVNEGLAACVNVLGEMDSVYRWQGEVEVDRERQIVIKTTAGRVSALEARLRVLHDYELPEFIVLPLAGGGESYLQWVRDSVAG